jgi:hypothetical protein
VIVLPVQLFFTLSIGALSVLRTLSAFMLIQTHE